MTVHLPAEIERFTAMRNDAVTLARRLLGQSLVRVLDDGTRLAGIIVETEAYLGAHDRGAHTFNGRRTPRNQSMYLPGGHAYVYFTYGMHFCMNVVCGAQSEGTAVLLRALEPIEGIDRMREMRGDAADLRNLCSGPGRLTQALGIDRSLDGESMLTSPRLFIGRLRRRVLPERLIGVSRRIGLNPSPRAAGAWAARRLRFYVRGNPHVSR
jgi:DNA-3-methyladenine glycosylase